MFALAYGSIPIVRAVGGLADTVQQYDPISFQGTGIRFNRLDPADLSAAMDTALKLYRREPHWSRLRANAMAQDNSIVRTGRSNIEVFDWAIKKVR